VEVRYMGAENLQDNLSKSLDEIEAKANAMLSKSEEVEKVEDKQDAPDEENVEKSVESDEEENVEKSVKSDEVSDEDDDGNDESEDDDKDDDKEEKTEKSMKEELSENDTIAKSVDASEFLSEFSRVHANRMDKMSYELNKSLETSNRVSSVLSKSFEAIVKSQEGLQDLVKSQASQINEAKELIKSLNERLDEVESQPVGRKAVVDVMEKSFNHSAGIEEPKKTLNKGETLAKMSNMLQTGNPGISVNDIVKYESTGQMSDSVKDLLSSNN
jgi:chromosome segregation ATPase